MRLRLLGTVGIDDGRAVVTLRRPESCVLATLALQAGRAVHVDTLTENVWGADPPERADETIARYVWTVRRAVRDAGGPHGVLRNLRPRRYQLDVDPEQVDCHRFRALVADAAARAGDGAHPAAAARYRQAVALWQGEALENVDTAWAERWRHSLHQEWVTAMCALLDSETAAGEHAAVRERTFHLLDRCTPTDRVVETGIRALASSGNHMLIPGFVDRAAKKMWDRAQAPVGSRIHAMAEELTRGIPAAARRDHVAANHPTFDDTEESVSYAKSHDGDKDSSRIVMYATLNGIVHQSGGDQHIIER